MSKKIERVGFATLDLAGQDEGVLVTLRVAPASRCARTQRPWSLPKPRSPFCRNVTRGKFQGRTLAEMVENALAFGAVTIRQIRD
jgi:hypothetical protein